MKRGPLMVLFCYTLWGVLPIYWKLLQSVNSYFVLSNRMIFTFVFSLILVVAIGKREDFHEAAKNKKERWRLFFAGFFCVLNWGAYIVAVNTNHIVDASLAYFMNPIMAIVIAAVVFKERLSPLQWIGVAFAVIGVLISVIAYGHIPWMALFIGVTFAIYGALQKGCRANGIVAMAIEMRWFMLPALIFAGVMLQRDVGATISTVQWFLLPTTGIITAVPLISYAIGIQETDYALSGILMYVNPTLQLMIGVLFYSEPLSRAQIITFIFVWVGLLCYLISMLYSAKKKKHLRF